MIVQNKTIEWYLVLHFSFVFGFLLSIRERKRESGRWERKSFFFDLRWIAVVLWLNWIAEETGRSITWSPFFFLLQKFFLSLFSLEWRLREYFSVTQKQGITDKVVGKSKIAYWFVCGVFFSFYRLYIRVLERQKESFWLIWPFEQYFLRKVTRNDVVRLCSLFFLCFLCLMLPRVLFQLPVSVALCYFCCMSRFVI